MPRLLVIDDRDQTVELVHRHLPQFDTVTRCGRSIPCQVCEERDQGCPLKCAHDWAEAAGALSDLQALPDLVVLDLHFALPEERLLPEEKPDLPTAPRARAAALETLRRRQGLLILERLRQSYPTLPVVLLTTTQEELGTVSSSSRDPLVYFCENEVVDSRTLASEITRALELHHTAQEGPVFWGRSPAMAELRRQLAVLARSPLPVLVQGETGTGKSFLAEHVLHPRSGQKGPLVVTDLSTVPSALLPAHLFGSRRGAYTGASEDHPGVFEQAHGGTLFLDEIANLDLDLQRQLLLVLERGAVTRLGDVRPRPAQVKLIAATNEDLGALVAAGRFRADLYMRLNPATRLRVPALRERTADLPELIRFALLDALRSEALRPLLRAYLARFPTPEDFSEEKSLVLFARPEAKAASREAFTVFLSRAVLQRLVEHPWPGNHRELRLLASNALVFALAQQLDAGSRTSSARAPAVLALSDQLIERLLGSEQVALRAREPRDGHARDGKDARDDRAGREEGSEAKGEGPARRESAAKGESAGRTRRIEVALRSGQSFAGIAADVERQYLRTLFEAHGGDLEGMAAELFGAGASGRRVHLRLNQLGLSVRELRRPRA